MAGLKFSRSADFVWETGRSHTWVSTTKIDQDPSSAAPKWFLCDRIPVPWLEDADEVRSRYNPLLDTGLFLRFSRLEPSPDAILEFAKKQGFLGGPMNVKVRVPSDEDG